MARFGRSFPASSVLGARTVLATADLRRAQVSWAELEVPTAPRRAQVSWAELEVPTAPRRAQVSWAELETPNAPRRAQVSWSEFETPTSPSRAQVSWAELQVPDVLGIEAYVNLQRVQKDIRRRGLLQVRPRWPSQT